MEWGRARLPFLLRKNQHEWTLRRQGGAGAVVDAAGQDVAVVAGDGEAVVHAAVPALLVLEQQRRVVERRQLREAEVAVPRVAPPRPGGRVVGEASAAAPDHDVRRRREGAGVVVRPLGHAHVLRFTHRKRERIFSKTSIFYHSWWHGTERRCEEHTSYTGQVRS